MVKAVEDPPLPFTWATSVEPKSRGSLCQVAVHAGSLYVGKALGKAGLKLERRLPPSCRNHDPGLVVVFKCAHTDGIAFVMGLIFSGGSVLTQPSWVRESPGGNIT